MSFDSLKGERVLYFYNESFLYVYVLKNAYLSTTSVALSIASSIALSVWNFKSSGLGKSLELVVLALSLPALQVQTEKFSTHKYYNTV